MLLWSSTEVLATIVCACIPVLRPLYVKIVHGSQGSSGRSGGRSYPLNDYSHKKGSGAFPSKGAHSGSRTTEERIYMGAGESVLEMTVKMGSENASEESILRESNAQAVGATGRGFDTELGITRTDEIKVTSSYKEGGLVR